jgi:hypothetical protein
MSLIGELLASGDVRRNILGVVISSRETPSSVPSGSSITLACMYSSC